MKDLDLNRGEDEQIYMQIREKERDSWHKVWVYSFVIFQTILLVVIVLYARWVKNKKRKRGVGSRMV